MNRIEKFLNQYASKASKSSYKFGLRRILDFHYGQTPEKLQNGEADKLLFKRGEQYFLDNRNYEQDIRNFFVFINGKIAPMTVTFLMTTYKRFLLDNSIEFPNSFWESLMKKRRGSRARTIDHVPTNKELKQIIFGMPLHGKALFLTLVSSGMRIGETLQLTLEDVEFNREPAKINIRGEYTKSGNSRFTFISPETKEILEQWLKKREDYLKIAVSKSQLYKKSIEDQRVFPFSFTTAQHVWLNALFRSGFVKKDSSTDRFVLHPHVLRKFFRTNLAKVIPVDIVEALMGHEAYLTEAYRKYSEDDLANFYKQGMHVLSIYGDETLKVQVEEQTKKLQEQDRNIGATHLTIQLLNENILNLQKQLVTVQSKNEVLEQRLAEIAEDAKYLRTQIKYFQEGGIYAIGVASQEELKEAVEQFKAQRKDIKWEKGGKA